MIFLETIRVGLAIAVLFPHSAWQVIREALAEWQTNLAPRAEGIAASSSAISPDACSGVVSSGNACCTQPAFQANACCASAQSEPDPIFAEEATGCCELPPTKVTGPCWKGTRRHPFASR